MVANNNQIIIFVLIWEKLSEKKMRYEYGWVSEWCVLSGVWQHRWMKKAGCLCYYHNLKQKKSSFLSSNYTHQYYKLHLHCWRVQFVRANNYQNNSQPTKREKERKFIKNHAVSEWAHFYIYFIKNTYTILEYYVVWVCCVCKIEKGTRVKNNS